ncbi:lipopolysaccharide transport periplasmic protein LptA [Pseudomonas sp. F1_0610]|uniref:lipopolysaccharide transport periplasmic protein LptA n=1 Tax=Pseudomonas sp. F1_0610 TaxID=3114284 RepID=UPI0039C171C3
MKFANYYKTLLALSLTLSSLTATALPSDREQPIRIQADTGQLDEKERVAVYKGNVIMTQGTMIVKGNTVTITQNPDGSIRTFTSNGGPAYFEQKPDVDKEVVKSYGQQIQYLVSQDRVVITGNGKIIQQGNTFEGEKIVYDTKRQIINAGSLGGNTGTGNKRIDMIIQPKKESGN